MHLLLILLSSSLKCHVKLTLASYALIVLQYLRSDYRPYDVPVSVLDAINLRSPLCKYASCSPKTHLIFFYQRTGTPEPTTVEGLLPSSSKPTRKPWPKPPSWGWDSSHDKPNNPSSSGDDWNSSDWGLSMPAKDDWWPIFPGKSSKTKSSKWKQGSWKAGAKGSKSGCIRINGRPCVGHVGKSGKSKRASHAWYNIIDFQSVVVRNSGERLRQSVGLSLAMLYCLSMVL